MLGYLEEGRPHFTEVMEEYEKESNRDNVEEEPIDSEEVAIKKGLNAKRKKMRGLYHLQWLVYLIV